MKRSYVIGGIVAAAVIAGGGVVAVEHAQREVGGHVY